MKFKAAMFDFDGTVTEKGSIAPSQEMADALVELAHKIPIAFCTGRQLESFEDRGLKALLSEIPSDKQEGFLENLHLIAENGSIGYFFNTNLDRFEEFYRVAWPHYFVDRDELMTRLHDEIKDYGEVYYKAHRVVIVMRTNLYNVPEEDKDINDVYEHSDKIFKIAHNILMDISPDYEDYLHIGNAGIGVVLCPADGDKDKGIKRFAEILNKERDLTFENDLRDILIVGDQPFKGGNDYYFLNGKYGTPYTVGDFVEHNKFPMPVIDDNGKRLKHSKGTLHLIKSIIENPL